MKDIDRLSEIWAEFVYEGKLDESVQPAVAEGWKKCRAAGVNPNGGMGKRVDDAVYQSIRKANSTLIETALPIMRSVHEIVENSGFLLVLTDSVGYLLEALGNREIISRTQDLRFIPGALWSNLEVGTNAISVALDSDRPIQMVGPEHYCRSHHSWICSAAPIHGLGGEVIGCLNMSGDAKHVHEHTLAVVLAAVYGIEGKLSILHSAELMRSALEGSADSIVLLGMDYRPVWMNSAAVRLLGKSQEELAEEDFRQIMPDVAWSSQDWAHGARYFSNDSRVVTQKGTRHCSAAVTPSVDYGTRTLNVTLKKQKHLINSVNKLSGNHAIYSFEDIYTQDAQMKKTLALAQKYARYDGNILIEGESGTGKELMAQAIHRAGSRAEGPFVSVACASIPRDRLETELFGYEAGADPKASEGNPGRFELADRGTLFLDEIGEMPLEFQAKLLRAVESHCITRVGGSQEIPLDIRIISTTNRRLEQLVASGGFRQDLYYRLNVLRLEIPALRERPGDTAVCAQRFLERLNSANPEQQKTMSPEFVAGLMDYAWPGNIRQLQNGIERAFYAATEPVLDEQSLRYALDKPEEAQPARDGQAGRILAALTLCNGDVEAAAKRLEISRATLYRHMKKFGIDAKSTR